MVKIVIVDKPVGYFSLLVSGSEYLCKCKLLPLKIRDRVCPSIYQSIPLRLLSITDISFLIFVLQMYFLRRRGYACPLNENHHHLGLLKYSWIYITPLVSILGTTADFVILAMTFAR